MILYSPSRKYSCEAFVGPKKKAWCHWQQLFCFNDDHDGNKDAPLWITLLWFMKEVNCQRSQIVRCCHPRLSRSVKERAHIILWQRPIGRMMLWSEKAFRTYMLRPWRNFLRKFNETSGWLQGWEIEDSRQSRQTCPKRATKISMSESGGMSRK